MNHDGLHLIYGLTSNPTLTTANLFDPQTSSTSAAAVTLSLFKYLTKAEWVNILGSQEMLLLCLTPHLTVTRHWHSA